MQKTMICLERPVRENQANWNNRVRDLAESFANQFTACGYAFKDQDVEPASLLEMIFTTHPHDAVLSVWSENAYQHDDFYAAVIQLGRYQAYGVWESSAIPFQFEQGRVEGMCQMAFIKKPQSQARQDWLKAWLADHTRVAIDTQGNFAYRQNLVAVPLPLSAKPSWPLMDAIVEENFPVIAMTSREAFFDAEGDPEKFERHQQIMMKSCFKFIDFENFDCVPMSQYVIK